MRLVLTSDLHGHLPEIPECDALIIAGDLCPIDNHHLDFQAAWLRYTFRPWLRTVPARHKIFIAGNHDFIIAEQPNFMRENDWPGIYLQDRGTLLEDVPVWGTPWANELPGWPFTAPEERLRDYWERIPVETEILIVHGPPYGYGDVVIGNVSGDELHVGSRSLDEMLYRLPNLRLVVYGHIHEGAGIYQHPSGVPLYNVSLMDVQYRPINPIRVLDFDL
jgi:Icc-related predicted phosphoesterase